jgi:hypothetical protein
MSHRIVVEVTWAAATGFTSRCGVCAPTLNTLRNRLSLAYGGAVDIVLSLEYPGAGQIRSSAEPRT